MARVEKIHCPCKFKELYIKFAGVCAQSNYCLEAFSKLNKLFAKSIEFLKLRRLGTAKPFSTQRGGNILALILGLQ